MRHTDIVIVGGGIAGATAAAMLGRAGVDTVLIDPHDAYPPDFRCEKFDASQLALLRKTGLAEAVLQSATRVDQLWVARFGRIVAKKRNNQFGFFYDGMVNAIRAAIPDRVAVVVGKVNTIAASRERQHVTLASGEEISARLVVMANGLNSGLRHNLGMGRDDRSLCHSISIGFNVEPVGRGAFDFRALTYFPERAADRMAYISFFPIGGVMRANLFVYRDMRDPWLREMRTRPVETMFALMPELRKITGEVTVSDEVKLRPVDLYETTNHRRPGIVLVGDAFATSCPAAGTGANKVFIDVERLCNHHIPGWLASVGMGAEKISAFYDDAVKIAADKYSSDKAFNLRALSIETGLVWRARRWAKFFGHLGVGTLRRMRSRLSAAAPAPSAATFES